MRKQAQVATTKRNPRFTLTLGQFLNLPRLSPLPRTLILKYQTRIKLTLGQLVNPSLGQLTLGQSTLSHTNPRSALTLG